MIVNVFCVICSLFATVFSLLTEESTSVLAVCMDKKQKNRCLQTGAMASERLFYYGYVMNVGQLLHMWRMLYVVG